MPEFLLISSRDCLETVSDYFKRTFHFCDFCPKFSIITLLGPFLGPVYGYQSKSHINSIAEIEDRSGGSLEALRLGFSHALEILWRWHPGYCMVALIAFLDVSPKRIDRGSPFTVSC